MTNRRKDTVALVVAWSIAAGCVRLGFWQISRLHERRALNAAIEARGRLPALAATGRESLDSVRWRRVHASGVYDYANERVWTGRSFDGVPGVALLTPLRLPGGAEVLVDRGWVPSPDATKIDPSHWREGDSAEVAGLAAPIPRVGVDQGDAPVPGFVIEDSIPVRAGAAPAGFTPLRWPALGLSEGPHLSYTIQWFSFAAIILGGSLALYRKRASEQGSHGDTTI